MFGRLNNRPDLLISSISILLTGTVGNILSLIVLCRKQLRQKNIGPYLIALCVSDLFVLYVSLFNTVLSTAGVYGDNYERLSCHMLRFFRAFFLDYSSWITVVITVQRTIAVYRPLSTYLRSSRIYATPVKVLSILFLVVVSISAIYTNSFRYENFYCKPPHKAVHVLLFSSVYSFFPAIILIVCNVAIVLKMYRRPAVGQTPHTAHNSAQTVRLVLAINIMFLIFTVPPSLLFTSTYFMDHISNEIMLTLSIVMNTNNAFNFVLYIVASRSFQEELKRMCKRSRIQKQEIWAISHHLDLNSASHSNSQTLSRTHVGDHSPEK